MINEVVAAIHHSYRFRLTRGRIALSATRFAHKSALWNPGNQSSQSIASAFYRDFCHSLASFCSVVRLIKTGIWWRGMIHVKKKRQCCDGQWYELFYIKKALCSHGDGRQNNEQNYWSMSEILRRQKRNEWNTACHLTWKINAVKESKMLCQ